MCETLWEYPCDEQSYGIEIDCGGAGCAHDDDGTIKAGLGDNVVVTLLDEGDLVLRFNMMGPGGTVAMSRNIYIHVREPAVLDLLCFNGWDKEPCDDSGWVKSPTYYIPIILSNDGLLLSTSQVRPWTSASSHQKCYMLPASDYAPDVFPYGTLAPFCRFFPAPLEAVEIDIHYGKLAAQRFVLVGEPAGEMAHMEGREAQGL